VETGGVDGGPGTSGPPAFCRSATAIGCAADDCACLFSKIGRGLGLPGCSCSVTGTFATYTVWGG
jgi:hypothetical protein